MDFKAIALAEGLTAGSIPDWLTLVALIGGAGWALYTYHKEWKWRRSEWVLTEVKEFLKEPHIRNALLMLDWRSRPITLLLDGKEATTTFPYEEDMLLHGLAGSTFSQQFLYVDYEVSIRESFDQLLGGLDRFYKFSQDKLIEVEQLWPYLDYWLDLIGDPKNLSKKPEHRVMIWAYIVDYGYRGVEALLKARGHEIPQTYIREDVRRQSKVMKIAAGRIAAELRSNRDAIDNSGADISQDE